MIYCHSALISHYFYDTSIVIKRTKTEYKSLSSSIHLHRTILYESLFDYSYRMIV